MHKELPKFCKIYGVNLISTADVGGDFLEKPTTNDEAPPLACYMGSFNLIRPRGDICLRSVSLYCKSLHLQGVETILFHPVRWHIALNLQNVAIVWVRSY